MSYIFKYNVLKKVNKFLTKTSTDISCKTSDVDVTCNCLYNNSVLGCTPIVPFFTILQLKKSSLLCYKFNLGNRKMPKVPVHTHTRQPNKCVYMTRDPQIETKISRIWIFIVFQKWALLALTSKSEGLILVYGHQRAVLIVPRGAKIDFFIYIKRYSSYF